MPKIAKYSFDASLTADQLGSYTLTTRNSPTNLISIFDKSLSLSFTGSDDPGGTSEGTTSHYMYYSTNNMGIANTGSISLECIVKINTTPPSGQRYCFISKQVPGTALLILYENNAGTPRLRFIRNRDYISTDDVNFNVTLSVGSINHIIMTYNGTNLTGYLNGVQVATRTSTGTGTTTTYTGLRIGQTGNNFGGCRSGHDTDEVIIHNNAINASYAKNQNLYYKGFI